MARDLDVIAAMNRSKTTTDHDEIRRWAESPGRAELERSVAPRPARSRPSAGSGRIRACRPDELGLLEWEGEFSHDRHIIRDTFTRTQQRTMQMLVAELDDEIVGQVWIDLVRCSDATYVWALRVRAPWRRRGIAGQLVAAAERTSALHGFAIVEVDVEPANQLARSFYERRGYTLIGGEPSTDMLKLRKRLCGGAGASAR